MKFKLLLFVAVMLSVGVKAQDFDTYPKFAGGNFNAYVAEHIEPIKGITKEAVTLYINVDSTGKASVESIYPNKSTELSAAFTRAVAAAPLWQPATLRGNPVNCMLTAYFNVDGGKVYALAQGRLPERVGDVVYTESQSSPQFISGNQGFDRFIRTNMLYPAEAKAKNVAGQIYVQFIVEKDGSLSSITVLRDPGSGLGEEAVRLLSLMPNWIPGIQNGKAVRVQYVLPIDFSLISKY